MVSSEEGARAAVRSFLGAADAARLAAAGVVAEVDSLARFAAHPEARAVLADRPELLSSMLAQLEAATRALRELVAAVRRPAGDKAREARAEGGA
jgi:hypothetical protein